MRVSEPPRNSEPELAAFPSAGINYEREQFLVLARR